MSIRRAARQKPLRSDRAFTFFVHFFLIVFMALIIFPILYIVAASLSSFQSVIGGKVWIWPVDFSLDCYKAAFRSQSILIGYRNSLLYTLAGTSINLVVTIACAYTLSFNDLKGRKLLAGFFAFTMLFSGGLVPGYMLVNRLGMIDTVWAVLIPNALSVWNMIIMRTFFQNGIPKELYEAAVVDGCSDIRYLLGVVIPLSGSIIAVIALYYAIGHWNSYFLPMLYLNTKQLYPLQIMLREILILGSMDNEMSAFLNADAFRMGQNKLLKFAVIVISSAPMMVIYVFIQKFFVKGVMIGAIKG